MKQIQYLTDKELEVNYFATQNELIKRFRREIVDPFIILKRRESAFRAITVAAVGNHSLLFIGPRGVGKGSLQAAAAEVNVVAFVLETCPCGYFRHPRQACKCRPFDIRKWVEKNRKMMESVWMTFEVDYIGEDILQKSPNGTSIDDIRKRIARGSVRPTWTDSETKTSLLKSAIRELGLSPERVIIIKEISRSIAALDQSPEVRLEHLAEAIQYRRRM